MTKKKMPKQKAKVSSKPSTKMNKPMTKSKPKDDDFFTGAAKGAGILAGRAGKEMSKDMKGASDTMGRMKDAAFGDSGLLPVGKIKRNMDSMKGKM